MSNECPAISAKRLAVFGRFVKDLAKLSKCSDKGTAAIILNEDGSQVLSIGVNGGPKHGIDCLCALGGKYTCVHAEANAIAKCTSNMPNKVMICTLSPCVTCASLIVNCDIAAVYYIDAYKDSTGLDILKKAGIYVDSLSNVAAKRDIFDEVCSTLLEYKACTITGAAFKSLRLQQRNTLAEKARYNGYCLVIEYNAADDTYVLEWR